MAERIKILGNPKIKHAYNVSQHVGPNRTNKPEDVELVQFLLSELLKVHTGNRGQLQGLPAPAVNGRFNVVLAYWIFEVQYQKQDGEPGAIIDGTVSPMKGSTLYYGPSQQWTIGSLNFEFAKKFPERFENLHLEPSLSPALKAAIAPK